MSDLRFLPGANFNLEGGSGRAPARKINELATDVREQSITWTGNGALVPINYGRRDVVGMLGPRGKIGTDLVISYIWGIGPIDAIEAIYLNDAVLPGSGVSVQHYLGTPTQTVDPWLASAVAGFNDRMRVPTRGGFRGVAYTVLRITTAAAVEGFPRARALGRWLANIRDPRDDSVGYSDNSALCLANWIEDPDFGLDSPVFDEGLEACADWCDSLLGGILPRCRLGISLTQGRAAREYASLLAEYAECFFVEEGEGYRMIPDAPVDLDSTPIITAAQLGKGSLSIECLDELNSPTEITVQYTQPGIAAEQPWALEPTEPVALPGVAEGDVSRISTTVSLEGVNRYEEGFNKGESRLARMQNRVRLTWRGFDAGVLHQLGEVVRIQRDELGVSLLPLRISRVGISAAGRHTFTGERYDPAHYPADLTPPGEFGVVPVNAIAVLSGGTVPDGWGAYNAANGRYIMGAGDEYAAGDTGGNTAISLSSETQDGGAHTPGDHGGYLVERYDLGGAEFGQRLGSPPSGNPVHRHGLTLSSVDPQIFTRTERLVIKTGSAATTIPASVRVFGAANLSLPGLTRITTAAGRMLAAGASAGNSGTTSRSVTITTASADDTHTHYNTVTNSGVNSPTDFGPFPTRYQHLSGGGPHTHQIELAIVASIKRFRLPMWGAGGDYRVSPGMVFFLPAGAAVPTDLGFKLCDGTEGTPDMLNFLFELAGIGNEMTTTGDNTVRIHGVTDQKGHGHRGGGFSSSKVTTTRDHESTVFHDHGFDHTQAYLPAYCALTPIMYIPGV